MAAFLASHEGTTVYRNVIEKLRQKELLLNSGTGMPHSCCSGIAPSGQTSPRPIIPLPFLFRLL